MEKEKQFKLPSVGIDNDTVTLGQWHYQVGDHVQEGADLVQVETAKAVEELASPWTGQIQKILVQDGENAKEGQVLAVLEVESAARSKTAKNDEDEQGPQKSLASEEQLADDSTLEDLLQGDATITEDSLQGDASESKPADTAHANQLDTVVIGAGPGGYVAAIRAAELGQGVTVVEDRYLGGVCLNVGCIPSKALVQAGHNLQTAFHSRSMGIHADDVTLDMGQFHQFKNQTVKTMTDGVAYLFRKHHIKVLWGRASFKSQHQLVVTHDNQQQTYTFNNAIIATGSRPVTLPNIPIKDHVLDSSGALDLEEVPDRMVIVGGGYIGCELAGAYANFGTQVTILEAQPKIMANFADDLVQTVLDDFAHHNVQVLTNAKLEQVADKAGNVEIGYTIDGQLHSKTVDDVVVAVGRRPNTDNLGLDRIGVTLDDHGLIEVNDQCRTSLDHIYAIGDVTSGPALAHKASYEGKLAAAAIAGQKVNRRSATIPAVCYVNTPIATTGLTVKQARERGFTDVTSATFPFRANGRAVTMKATNGFVRLVYYGHAKWLLGAQIVGAAAADLIGELNLAIDSGQTVNDLAQTIAPHPSLGEAILDSADLALGLPINI